MLTTILYLYLAGWVGASSYGIYQCQTKGGGHYMSDNVCSVLMVPAGAVWPAAAYQTIHEKVSK